MACTSHSGSGAVRRRRTAGNASERCAPARSVLPPPGTSMRLGIYPGTPLPEVVLDIPPGLCGAPTADRTLCRRKPSPGLRHCFCHLRPRKLPGHYPCPWAGQTHLNLTLGSPAASEVTMLVVGQRLRNGPDIRPDWTVSPTRIAPPRLRRRRAAERSHRELQHLTSGAAIPQSRLVCKPLDSDHGPTWRSTGLVEFTDPKMGAKECSAPEPARYGTSTGTRSLALAMQEPLKANAGTTPQPEHS